MRVAFAVIVLSLAACTPPAATTDAPADTAAAAIVDPAIAAVVEQAMPGVTITGGEADGEGEFEVSGTLNGQEYEFDLMGPDGGWRVAGIRHDIAWADAPESVRAALLQRQNEYRDLFTPARVVEVREFGADGVLYEVYDPEAPPDAPILIRLMDDEAAVMPPAH